MSEVPSRVSGGKPVGARPVPGVKGGPRTGQPPGGAKPEGPHPPGPASLRLLRVGERARVAEGPRLWVSPTCLQGPQVTLWALHSCHPHPRFILDGIEVSVRFLHTGPVCESLSSPEGQEPCKHTHSHEPPGGLAPYYTLS